jgi:hypothetical protein
MWVFIYIGFSKSGSHLPVLGKFTKGIRVGSELSEVVLDCVFRVREEWQPIYGEEGQQRSARCGAEAGVHSLHSPPPCAECDVLVGRQPSLSWFFPTTDLLIPLFFFFGWDWDLDSGPYAC